MGEDLGFGASRFKCPFSISRENAKHCAACRADWREELRRRRMTPQQKAADTRKRKAKTRRVLAAMAAIGAI